MEKVSKRKNINNQVKKQGLRGKNVTTSYDNLDFIWFLLFRLGF